MARASALRARSISTLRVIESLQAFFRAGLGFFCPIHVNILSALAGLRQHDDAVTQHLGKSPVNQNRVLAAAPE